MVLGWFVLCWLQWKLLVWLWDYCRIVVQLFIFVIIHMFTVGSFASLLRASRIMNETPWTEGFLSSVFLEVQQVLISGTVRALSRINFVVFSQLVGAELPRGVASILVVPCKFGYRNHSKYHSFAFFFCLFLAETVVMNRQKSLCFLFRQLVYSWVCWHPWHTWPPPPMPHHWDVLYWQCFELEVEMLAAGRLPLNCCKAVATLLPDCCSAAAIGCNYFMLCDYSKHWVLYVYAWEYVLS